MIILFLSFEFVMCYLDCLLFKYVVCIIFLYLASYMQKFSLFDVEIKMLLP